MRKEKMPCKPNHCIALTVQYLVTIRYIQAMNWPIARELNGEEKIDIQILTHNRYVGSIYL